MFIGGKAKSEGGHHEVLSSRHNLVQDAGLSLSIMPPAEGRGTRDSKRKGKVGAVWNKTRMFPTVEEVIARVVSWYHKQEEDDEEEERRSGMGGCCWGVGESRSPPALT